MKNLLKKIAFYLPKLFFSRLYATFLYSKGKDSPHLNQKRFAALIEILKRQMLSPKRNGQLYLTKQAIAGYYASAGDVIIDVGAHIGGYTSFYSVLTGQTGKVYSYEAHPLIFQTLRKRFEKQPQVAVRNFAVSDGAVSSIKIKIYPDDLKAESATVETLLMNEKRMPGRTEIVEVASQGLDVLLSELTTKCSLIKIDVEGHEHAVIEGAAKLIDKHQPVFIYEYGYIPGEFEPNTIEQLERKNYAVYDCQTGKRVAPKYVVEGTDLVAIPIEKSRELEHLLSLIV